MDGMSYMLIVEALTLNPTKRRPVWIMRQAGRYLAEFRALRQKHSFDELCHNADLATEVSLMPLKKYKLDAAIVFSDILFPLRAMGASLAFTEDGPVLDAPKSEADFKKFKSTFIPEKDTPAILATLSRLKAELSKDVALLGFAGAPFTMLAYLLEGRLTKDLKITKRWLAEKPKLCHEWLQHLSISLGRYLDSQAQSGANAVQLFDTWAGILSPKSFEEFALPYARQTLSAVTVPSIYYVNGVAGVLQQASSVGAQCLSVDWRTSLADVRSRLPHTMAIQGNLDPYDLLLPKDRLREKVFEMCASYGRGPGHIVNLGHGIVPEIPEDHVRIFIDAANEWSTANL
jgi:uroporphyrinogen decarboxylase